MIAEYVCADDLKMCAQMTCWPGKMLSKGMSWFKQTEHVLKYGSLKLLTTSRCMGPSGTLAGSLVNIPTKVVELASKSAIGLLPVASDSMFPLTSLTIFHPLASNLSSSVPCAGPQGLHVRPTNLTDANSSSHQSLSEPSCGVTNFLVPAKVTWDLLPGYKKYHAFDSKF